LGVTPGSWQELVWVDHDHVFAFAAEDKGPIVFRGGLVSASGGPVGPTWAVSAEELGAKAADPGDRGPGAYRVELGIDKRQRVWTRLCVERDVRKDDWDDDDCKRFAFARLDVKARAVVERSMKRPSGFELVQDRRTGLSSRDLPAVKPPPGYRMTDRRKKLEVGTGEKRVIRVVTCEAPDRSPAESDHDEWPLHLRVESARWVLADPPLLQLEGKRSDPLEKLSVAAVTWRDCSDELTSVRFLAPGVWAAYFDGGEAPLLAGPGWVVYDGKRPLLAVRAPEGDFVVSPF
jgi:hypothetical protein